MLCSNQSRLYSLYPTMRPGPIISNNLARSCYKFNWIQTLAKATADSIMIRMKAWTPLRVGHNQESLLAGMFGWTEDVNPCVSRHTRSLTERRVYYRILNATPEFSSVLKIGVKIRSTSRPLHPLPSLPPLPPLPPLLRCQMLKGALRTLVPRQTNA